jgi:Alpha/beta hydrolase family
MASEQHSSLAPRPKLALLQRSVKINVSKKQRAGPLCLSVAACSSRILQGIKTAATMEISAVAKSSKSLPMPAAAVRTRRAYFDCRFGQLHVRTAFPTTGGFDEQVTLFCLHPDRSSSRTFTRFLAEIADVRSVYAPDLPGCGESDPSAQSSVEDAADAMSDLADDLRLRQIDLLGVRGGGSVALKLAAARPELVRRLVLLSVPSAHQLSTLQQPSLLMRSRLDSAQDLAWAKAALPNGKFVEIADSVDDLFDVAPKILANQISGFLSGRP